ncbi:MAG: hypothetical protein WC972_02475 [Trueperaceae bacterium]
MLRRLRQLDLDRQYTAGSLVRHLLLAACVIYAVTSAAVALLDWWAS